MSAALRAGLASLIFLSALAGGAAADDESLENARRALAEGRLVRAERLLEELVRASPEAVEPNVLLGRARLRQGRFASALEPLERAAALDPDWPGLESDLGTALRHTGDYARARDALERAIRESPDDATAYGELGLVELELGQFDLAQTHFERARSLDPSLDQVMLYNIGVARSRAGDPAGSSRALREAIAVDATTGTARRAERILDTTQPTPQPTARPWRLSAYAGLMYDDNVTTAVIDESRDEDDEAATADISAGYTWRGENPDWRVDATYDASQTSYFHEAGADLQTHTGGLSAQVSGKRVDSAAGYSYTLVTLGGERLLEIHEMRPTLQFAPQPQWFVIAGPRLAHKEFADDERDSDVDRDANQVALGSDLFYFFRGYQAWVLLSGEVARENADDVNYDWDGWQARLALHLPFDWLGASHVLDLAYRYQARNYDSPTSGGTSADEHRDDRIFGPRLRLVRALSQHTSVRLDVENTRSDSNLPESDYRQNTVGLSLGYTF